MAAWLLTVPRCQLLAPGFSHKKNPKTQRKVASSLPGGEEVATR